MWEYKRIYMRYTGEKWGQRIDQLKEYSKEGWELCGTHDIYGMLKRSLVEQKEEELKSCAHCGARGRHNRMLSENRIGPQHVIGCADCQMRTIKCGTYAEAKEIWNRRI